LSHLRKITFLLRPTYDIFLVYYITKVFGTRKPAFGILLICTKRLDKTNRISTAIVNKAIS